MSRELAIDLAKGGRILAAIEALGLLSFLALAIVIHRYFIAYIEFVLAQVVFCGFIIHNERLKVLRSHD